MSPGIIHPAAIIDDLAAQGARFVLWAPIPSSNGGKPRKVPFRINGIAASSTDPATWMTYDDAIRAFQAGTACRLRGKDAVPAAGIGFVLGEGIAGIDLDQCRDVETGEIAPWARKIIDDVRSYTEISPSGTGVKIFARADPVPQIRAHRAAIGAASNGEDIPSVEIYSAARYFALTGQILEDAPDEVADATEAFERLVAWVAAEARSAGGGSKGTAGEHAMSAYTAAELEALAQVFGGTRNGNGWLCHCPAHDDARASLSLTLGKGGKLLWKCHAGCDQDAVLEGLRPYLNGDARTGKTRDRKRWIAAYDYRDEGGDLLFQVVRWEPKGFSQRRPARPDDPPDKVKIDRQDGGRWVWSIDGVRRVLYRLRALLDSDPVGPVFVCEGEKDVDRLVALGLVATTNPQGAGKWNKVDPTARAVLHGRHVVILPDADEPGRNHRDAIGRDLIGKAASVRVLELSEKDVSDWFDAGHTPDELRELIAEVPPWTPSESGPAKKPQQRGFLVSSVWTKDAAGNNQPPGVYRKVVKKDEETGEKVETWPWFCSLLEIEADTRNAAGEQWGRLVVVTDRDGCRHEWAMPMAMLAGDGTAYRENLLSFGLELAPGRFGRDCLHEYLTLWSPKARARCVDRTGWHGPVFVLPDVTYGSTGDESVILQTTGAAPSYTTGGTFEGWQQEIAKPAIGNSRLVLSISTAFAAPALYLTGDESGGFHLSGGSSTGKTTALHCAASVWGRHVHSWRTTDNAGEGLARGASDALLCLDDIGQADGRVVDAIAYMLGNGAGKARMRRDSTARPIVTWRVLFLSTGEIGLGVKMQEAGRRARAGQEVRVVEVAADAGKGLGIFEDLHEFATADALARHLRLAADRHRGHAARAFLAAIVEDVEAVAKALAELRQQWIADHLPAGADGQVSRVARRFGLVAAAGELAITLGHVPWPEGEAERAAARCFADWMDARDGSGPGEIRDGIAQVRAFFEAHGSSRFEPAWDGQHVPFPDRTINRAGFRRKEGNAGWEFYVLPEAWRREVCRGFDTTMIAREMLNRGWLRVDSGGKLARKPKIPGHGAPRVYHITSSFLEQHGDAS